MPSRQHQVIPSRRPRGCGARRAPGGVVLAVVIAAVLAVAVPLCAPAAPPARPAAAAPGSTTPPTAGAVVARGHPGGASAVAGAGAGRPAATARPHPSPAVVLPPLDPGPPGGVGPGVPPAPPPGAGTPAPGARYSWPLLPPPGIGTRFRAPPHPYGRGHRGVDLVGAEGQPVLVARRGTVVFAGPVGGRGVVSVAHDDGLRTTYEPVRAVVPVGAVLGAGAVLGLLQAGHAGCAPAVCLHWGVRRGHLEYLDPLVLLRPARVRLLPVPVPWPAGT